MGSMLPGKAPKSTATNTVVVPSFLNTQNQSLVARAADASNRPFTPYTGERVSPFNEDILSAFSGVRAAQGQYAPLFAKAGEGASAIFDRANGPTSEQLRSLMNPFTENVLDVARRRTIDDFQTREQEARRREGIASGFGTSGTALARAQRSKDLLREIADMETRGMSDAYDRAIGQFNTGTGALQTAVQSALTAGTMGQEGTYRDLAELLSSGQNQRSREQDLADFRYNEFEREQAYPYEQVNFLANILNPMTAAYRGGQTTESTKGGGGSSLGNILGTAASVASLFGGFSDERIKENIQEVGKLDNGLTVYKYNFKGSPVTQIGLIAQEVEKENPDAVGEINGIKTVNYDEATDGPIRKKNKTLRLSSNKKVGDKFAAGGLVGGEMPESRESRAKRYIPAISLADVFPGISGRTTPADSSGGGMGGLKELLGSGGLDKALGGLNSAFGGIFNNKYGPSLSSLPGAGSFNSSYNDVISSGANPFSGMGLSFAEGGPVQNPFLYLMKKHQERGDDAARRKQEIRQIILGEDYANTSPIGKVGKQFMRFISEIPPTVTETFADLDAETYKQLGWLTAPPSEYKSAVGIPEAPPVNKTEDSDMKARIAAKLGASTPMEIQGKPNMPPKNDADFEAYRESMRQKNAAAVNGEAAPLPVKNVGEITQPIPVIDDSRVMPEASTSFGDTDKIFQEYFSKEAPQPEEDKVTIFGREVNMPLLMAGLAMLGTPGDFSEQLTAGVKAGIGQADSQKKDKQAKKEAMDKERRQQMQDYLELLRVMAYIEQVKKTGQKAPVDPELAQLQKDRLRALIEATKAKAKKDASGSSDSEDDSASPDMSALAEAYKEALSALGQDSGE